MADQTRSDAFGFSLGMTVRTFVENTLQSDCAEIFGDLNLILFLPLKVIEDSRNGIAAANTAGCLCIYIPDLWFPENDEDRKLIRYECENLKGVIEFFEKNK